MKKTRKPGGGRKPGYSKEKNLKEQMDAAVKFYKNDMTLQAIAVFFASIKPASWQRNNTD